MKTFTTGPWLLDGETKSSVTDETYHCIESGRGVFDEEKTSGFSLVGYMSKEDALLIRGAPDMAVALDGIIEYWNDDADTKAKKGGLEHIVDLAATALKKARGEQP